MKIIKEGNPKLGKAKPVQATCANCKAVVEEAANKLRWEHYPRNESLAREKCPCCGDDIFFYQ